MIRDVVTAHDEDGDPILVLFRQLNAPVPDGRKSGMHWQVEVYETAAGYPSAPVGLCWVLDPAENLPPDRGHEVYLPASVDDLLVADGRRRGPPARCWMFAGGGRICTSSSPARRPGWRF
jgi:hypothetical protein